jgi:hypothetical protein
MCKFTYSVAIETAGVLGTLVIAALAIWGDKIRYYLVGPKLRIGLHDPEGVLATLPNGSK